MVAFITLHGIVAFLVGFAMAWVGAIGLAAEGVAGLVRARRGPVSWVSCWGPVAYAAVGFALMWAADSHGPWLPSAETLDGLALLVAPGMVVPWVWLHRERRDREDDAYEASGW